MRATALSELDSLPERIDGASAWYGPAMEARRDWIETLTDTESAEVEAATERLAAGEIDIAAMRASDFPLPALAPR